MDEAKVTITQADRDVVYWVVPVKCCADKRWIATLEEAFARHRIAAEQRGREQGLREAAAYIQQEWPFDKRKLVPAIRSLIGGDSGHD